MQIPSRLIEIGGADNPIVPTGLQEYVGIDPLYGINGFSERAKKVIEERKAHATLRAAKVEQLLPGEVYPAELVVMQNVLGNMVRRHLPTVKAALGFVSGGGTLVIIENIYAAHARLDEVEMSMDEAGYWTAPLRPTQQSFQDIYIALGLGEPNRTHNILKINQPTELVP